MIRKGIEGSDGITYGIIDSSTNQFRLDCAKVRGIKNITPNVINSMVEDNFKRI